MPGVESSIKLDSPIMSSDSPGVGGVARGDGDGDMCVIVSDG